MCVHQHKGGVHNLTFTQQVLPDAGFFVWITLTAAIICLLTSMLVLRWSSTQFADETVSALSYLHQSLSLGLAASIGEEPLTGTTQIGLQDILVKKSLALTTTYQQAMYEIRIGRVGGMHTKSKGPAISDFPTIVKEIQPLIGIVESIRRELSWGVALPQSLALGAMVADEAPYPLNRSCMELGDAILLSMSATQQAIAQTYKKSGSWRIVLTAERYAISMARD